MNQYIKESDDLFSQGHRNWGYPLILGLENNNAHDAIRWVTKVVRDYVKKSNHPNINEWLVWLNELEDVSVAKDYDEVNYLEQKSRYIFNVPPARNIYLTLISHLYAAEGCYRIKNFNLYTKFLWDILNNIINEIGEDKSTERLFIIEQYPSLS